MRRLLSILSILSIVGALVPATAKSASPIELSLNLTIPPIHTRYLYAIKPWIEEVERRTGGQVKIVPHFSNSISPPSENYESVVTGLADIAEGLCMTQPGRFPVADIMDLPIIVPTCKNPSRVIWEIYKRFPSAQKEWSDTHLLALHSCLQRILMTTRKPVRSLEDARGLKVFPGGRIPSKTARALNMSPVMMTMGEIYLSAEKGVIDAAILPTDVLEARKLAEVFKYSTNVALGYTGFYLTMNRAKYNSLPKDVRTVFDELSGDYLVDLFGKAWWKITQDGAKYAIEKHGHQFIDLSADELARWKKEVNPVWDAVTAELESKGFPGEALLKELRVQLSKYDQVP